MTDPTHCFHKTQLALLTFLFHHLDLRLHRLDLLLEVVMSVYERRAFAVHECFECVRTPWIIERLDWCRSH